MNKIYLFLIFIIGLSLVSAGIFGINTVKEKDTLIQKDDSKFILPNNQKEITLKKSYFTELNKVSTENNLKNKILEDRCYDIYLNEERVLEVNFNKKGRYCLAKETWIEYMLLENLITMEEADVLLKQK
jgi:hypothetical protein